KKIAFKNIPNASLAKILGCLDIEDNKKSARTSQQLNTAKDSEITWSARVQSNPSKTTAEDPRKKFHDEPHSRIPAYHPILENAKDAIAFYQTIQKNYPNNLEAKSGLAFWSIDRSSLKNAELKLLKDTYPHSTDEEILGPEAIQKIQK